MDGRTCGWNDGGMNEWMDNGSMVRWIDGKMRGLMNG